MDTTTDKTTTAGKPGTVRMSELPEHPQVQELREVQQQLGLPDEDFARVVRLSYSGSSWGKMKAGTFSGNPAKALRAVKTALAHHHLGGTPETVGEAVVFDHVRAACDAVAIARTATDEHKLVVVCGSWGAGKSVTAEMVRREHGGHYLHGRPSWASSYLRALMGIAHGIGIGSDFRSVGQGETEILRALEASPALLVIDEANHFNRDSLNFLKTVLNETRAVVCLMTLPGHLARIAATASEETRQLLRRAVAIIHIGPVTSAEVLAIQASFYPELALGHHAPRIASAANKHARLDTVRRILEEAEDAADVPAAVERVEGAIQTILKS